MEQFDDLMSRKELIHTLTEWLPTLRMSLRMTQEELAARVGISRQTFSSIELKKHEMTWASFLALSMLFLANDSTRTLMACKKNYIPSITWCLSVSEKPSPRAERKGTDDGRNSV